MVGVLLLRTFYYIPLLLGGANISVPSVNGKKIMILFLFRITGVFVLTCGSITFVGLIKIATKKVTYKKSVQPINVLTISAKRFQKSNPTRKSKMNLSYKAIH